MVAPRFLSFWSINATADLGRLCEQLDCFSDMGLDGAVIHPRAYPAGEYLNAEYLRVLSEAIVHARSLGLAIWLYDENGWPSGSANRTIPRDLPELRQRWLALEPVEDGGAWDTAFAGRRFASVVGEGPGVDYLHPEVAARFLERTHQVYRTGLSPEAFEHVEAFFCDEPEFGLGLAHADLPRGGAVPWTSDLPERFLARYGYDLVENLGEVFHADSSQVRVDLWELLSDLLRERFLGVIDDWCSREGKLFTVHVKGEDNPLFQVPTVGSLARVLGGLRLPGLDSLGRAPVNGYFPRLVSSLSRQFAGGRVMAESFGGAGWGSGPADLETHLSSLIRQGCTDLVLHLSQYRLDSAAIADWPPSLPLHVTWQDAFRTVISRVRSSAEQVARPRAETLLIAPQRAIMRQQRPAEFVQANVHDGSGMPATPAAGINDSFMELVAQLAGGDASFDITDERTLERFARAGEEGVTVGRERYRRVVADVAAELNTATRAALGVTAVTKAERPPAVRPDRQPRLSAEESIMVPGWSLEAPPTNELLVECAPLGGGRYRAHFAVDLARHLSVELRFADHVTGVEVNGARAGQARQLWSGTSVELGIPEGAGAVDVSFSTTEAVSPGPYLWVTGGFRVRAESGFLAVASTIQTTQGPFTLAEPHLRPEPDLLAAGYPFLRAPLRLVARLETDREVRLTRLLGVRADAYRIDVGLGWGDWHWRDGEVGEPLLLAGSQTLRVELVPNGFNHFGPHHYYRADPWGVSPGQMGGRKNFLDPADAAEVTHDGLWRFRRFDAPTAIGVVPVRVPEPVGRG